MHKKRFPISYWCPPDLDGHTDAYFDRLALAGMTLIPSPTFTGEPGERAGAEAFFARAEARGMEVMLFDRRTCYGSCISRDAQGTALLDEAAYAEGVRQCMAQYDRRSVRCIYVGDEPGKRDYAAMCACCRIIRELTGREGYVNLLPYYPKFLGNTGERDYDVYLQKFLEDSRSGILSQDFYAQCLEGEGMHEDYWHVLQCQYDVARAAGAEMWHTVMACKHFDRRVPDYNDFRFQISMALAYGAKEISFFTLQSPPNASPKETNFTDAPLDWWGEPTATFDALCRATRELHTRFGDIFLSLSPLRVTHYPIVPYTYQRPLPRMNTLPFTPNENIYSLSLVRGLPRQHVVISEFVHTVTGESYVFIANANPRTSVSLAITFENALEVRRYDALGREYTAVASPDGKHGRLHNACFWLSPGQGELHRIVR